MSIHPSWDDIERAVLSDSGEDGDDYLQASGSSSYGQHKRTRTRRRRRDNWRLDDRDLTDLGQERLDDYIQVFKCDQCTKPVLARYKDYHKQNCDLVKAIQDGRASPSILDPDPKKRKRRLSDGSDTPSQADGANGAYASGSSVSPQKKMTKKAVRAMEVEERRKQRLENKARKEREAAESKGRKRKGQPLDVNRQCGVINDNGQPCMRSLTCKTHSMGAKRSVEGRSKSYDELLLEWQKANNPAFLAKLEKREEERAKALEEKRVKKLEKKKKKDARRLAASGGANGTAGGAGGVGGAMNAAGGSGRGLSGATGNLGGLQGDEFDGPSTDLYALGMEDSEVELELQALLTAVRNHTRDERLAPVPVAPRRTYHGLFTSQAKRMLLLRQAFSGAGGSNSANIGSSSSASTTGGSAVGAGRSQLNGMGSFKPPPVVAGGGWGSGMFASHS